jgi:phage tail protein X
VPKLLLSYLLPYSRTFNCTSKTTGWFTKGAEIDPNLPHANKVLPKVHTHSYILMDFFQSHQIAKPLLSYLLPYSRTFNCTSKRLAGSPKGAEIDPNLPHANKVLPKVAHAFLYTLMDFQSHQTVPKLLLSYLLPYSRTFNCTSKTTGWFTKRS